jgi:hypothetical protein
MDQVIRGQSRAAPIMQNSHPVLVPRTADRNLSGRAKWAGLIGMGGGLLWIPGVIMEHTYGLQGPISAGTSVLAFWAVQILFLVAGTAILVGYLGLWWDQATGPKRFGRIALGILIAAWGAEVLAMWAAPFGLKLDALQPVGGLAQMVGMPLAAVAVLIGREWRGWQRYAPLVLAVVYDLVVMVPIFTGLTPDGPTTLTESSWMAAVALLNLALFTQGGRPQAQSRTVLGVWSLP